MPHVQDLHRHKPRSRLNHEVRRLWTYKILWAKRRTVALGLADEQPDLADAVSVLIRERIAQHAEDGADAPDAARARHHAQRQLPLLLWTRKCLLTLVDR